MKTSQQLIADYLANGGKITACGSSRKATHKRDPWWVRSDWIVVKIPQERMSDATSWLEERAVEHYANRTAKGGAYTVRVKDADQAMLFKLTFGGAL